MRVKRSDGHYPLGNVKIAIEHGPLIVSFPIENGDFIVFLYVYQRVFLGVGLCLNIQRWEMTNMGSGIQVFVQLWPEIPVINTNKILFIECLIPLK